jgi:hypothetical protein
MRFCGDRATVVDARARKTDLSPREELAEARKLLANLENSKLSYPEFPGQHDFSELKEKIRRLDFIVNDSAPPKRIASLSELNERNAEFYGARR